MCFFGEKLSLARAARQILLLVGQVTKAPLASSFRRAHAGTFSRLYCRFWDSVTLTASDHRRDQRGGGHEAESASP